MNFASTVRTSQLTVGVQKEFHSKIERKIFDVQIQLLKFQWVKEKKNHKIISNTVSGLQN